MEILTVPNPILKRRCEPNVSVKVQDLSEMIRLMQHHNGIRLAAPQVGINGRFFVTAWGEIFINPDIVEVSTSMYLSQEGCLSIPDKQFLVTRHKWVRLRGDRRYFQGVRAAVIQHETDHLNGILISDIGQEAKDSDARTYLAGASSFGAEQDNHAGHP
jgi:peptide deformylase